MRRVVGPFQIVERRNRFEVRRGRALLSTHANYLDAEEAALRAWLRKGEDKPRSEQAPP
jgi:hypothetical protein